MDVLLVNAGSSSVKLSVVGDRDRTRAEVELGPAGDAGASRDVAGFVAAAGPVGAVAHRIVHGGPAVPDSTVIDDAVRTRLDAGAEIAPLHVPGALLLVDMLRPLVRRPHVACLDTAFHAGMPAAAATYAVPDAWRRAGLRRFGFHGLAYGWALRRAAQLLGRAPEDLQLVAAHLGAGASVCAVRDGRSVDTSMGFTPLEGLVMATRSGTVDPGALLWLQRARGLAVDEMLDALEHRSGLLGLTGTADMRAVLERAGRGDRDAAAGLDVYVHRLRREIAAMAASLDRLDALVLSGGVGENAAPVRELVCAGLGVLGLAGGLRETAPEGDGAVSAAGARVPVLVVHAREDLEMARIARSLVGGPSRTRTRP